jgi:hypothetical protein
MTWARVDVEGDLPCPRMGAACAATGDGDVLVFGGSDEKNRPLNDAYVIQVFAAELREQHVGRELLQRLRTRGRRLCQRGRCAAVVGLEPLARLRGKQAQRPRVPDAPTAAVWRGAPCLAARGAAR